MEEVGLSYCNSDASCLFIFMNAGICPEGIQYYYEAVAIRKGLLIG